MKKFFTSRFAGRWGRRRLAFGALALILAAAALVGVALALTGSASLTGSNFEIDNDANLKVDNASPSIDWLAGGTGTDLRSGVKAKQDTPSGKNDSAFGQGTSEDMAAPTIKPGSIPPQKSDLSYFGVFKEEVGSKAFVHLFWTRVQDPTGTTNMDFEFNKLACDTTKTGGGPDCSTNGVTPKRSVGDLLIEYHIDNGGSTASLSMREWGGSAWGPESALSGKAIGSINSTSISAANSDGVGPLSPRTFGEASIDLSALLGTGKCASFGSAYLKSRSSDSFSSEIKDFIAPETASVTNCGSVLVKKTDKSNGNPLSGATFSVAPGSTDANGTTATKTDLTYEGDGLYCAENLKFGDHTVTEDAAPTGYDKADPVSSIVNVSKPLTCAERVSANDPDHTFADPPQKGKIVVEKRDAGDPGALLGGAKFELYKDDNGTAGLQAGDTKVGDCTTASSGDDLGKCSFAGLDVGNYLVKETEAPSGYDLPAQTVQAVTIVVATGGDVKTVTYHDSPTKGKIVVEKRDAGDPGALLGGAKFKLYKDVNGDGALQKSGANPDTQVGSECTTPDTGTDLGKCTFASLDLGKYLVEETAAPSGYDLPSTTVKAVEVGIAAGGDVDEVTYHDSPTKGEITVLKKDDSSPQELLGGAVFRLYKDDGDGSLGTGDTQVGDDCTTPSDGDDKGKCTFTGLEPGSYLVEEHQAPDGYDLPTETEKVVTIAVVEGGDSKSVSFTDPRQFKVVTIVCQTSGGAKLYPSKVKFEGVETTSLKASDLPAGVSESEACGLTGASYAGLNKGDYTIGNEVHIGTSPEW
jgi:hypothetical protein